MLDCLRQTRQNAERTRGRSADAKSKMVSLFSVLDTRWDCADDLRRTVLSTCRRSCPRARGEAIFAPWPFFDPLFFLCLAKAATREEGQGQEGDPSDAGRLIKQKGLATYTEADKTTSRRHIWDILLACCYDFLLAHAPFGGLGTVRHQPPGGGWRCH